MLTGSKILYYSRYYRNCKLYTHVLFRIAIQSLKLLKCKGYEHTG